LESSFVHLGTLNLDILSTYFKAPSALDCETSNKAAYGP
jgi:hypothetical protein